MQLPKKLDDAFASGSPKGLEGTVTAGQISAVRNFREIRNVAPNTLLLGYDADTQFIQMTNPISAGNSGGPLVNIFGEVVGVNTCSVVRAQNLNFAVASNHVQALLEKAKGESVRSLLTLPRRVRPEPPRRTRAPELVRPVPFEAKLPDGRTVTRHSVSVPEEIVKSLLKDDSRVDADVENVGKIEAGVLLGVGPSLFGLPDGYALIRHNDFDAPKPPATFRTLYETTVRTLEQESRERRRAVSSRYGIPMPYRSREPEVDMQGIVGIVGFKRGQLDGHVHLFDQHPIYYGQWTGGRPSPQALFFIETAPGIGAIIRRGNHGRITTVLLIRHGEVADMFPTLHEATANVDAKALVEALQQRETTFMQVAERIAEAVQAEAKDIQAEIIAARQTVSRATIASRINARRAANAAAQGQRFQEATGRRGL